jgi:hypothetical protein
MRCARRWTVIAALKFVYPAAALVMDGWVYGRVPSAVQAAGMGLMGPALFSVRRGAG